MMIVWLSILNQIKIFSHYIDVWSECDYDEWVVSCSSKYVVCVMVI